MQVLIEVDEDTIKSAKRDGLILAPRYRDDLTQAIRNSIVLPKGHGRLIDEKELGNTIARMWENRKLTNTKYNTFLGILDYIPTVVEADGGDAE